MDEEVDIQAYKEAKDFLINNTPLDVSESLIESYLNTPNTTTKDLSINQINFRLLESAQNANMKAGVIGGSIDGVQNLGRILFEFNPAQILTNYYNKSEKLLDDIILKLQPRGKMKRNSRSLWPMYCKTIISASVFLSQFETGEDFYEWANYFYCDDRLIASLPLLLEAEIKGIGFPLACDFLKELGYINYGKPDIHIIELFTALNLIPPQTSNYYVLKAIVRISNNVGVSAYNVDKLFWLLGSGYFYKNLEIGNQGRVKSLKDDFIEHWNTTVVKQIAI